MLAKVRGPEVSSLTVAATFTSSIQAIPLTVAGTPHAPGQAGDDGFGRDGIQLVNPVLGGLGVLSADFGFSSIFLSKISRSFA
jgi:hypothetical protein